MNNKNYYRVVERSIRASSLDEEKHSSYECGLPSGGLQGDPKVENISKTGVSRFLEIQQSSNKSEKISYNINYKPENIKGSIKEKGVKEGASDLEDYYLEYYLIGIIYLIFDVEVMLILPYIPAREAIERSGCGIVFLIFFLGITGGLIIEWVRGLIKLRTSST